MNMLLTIFILIIQAVCLALIASTIMGWRIRVRGDSHQLMHFSDRVEN
jgi:hypothetical protein